VSDTFHARIPTLSDTELRQYLDHPLDYRSEAVEAALAELRRRGQEVPLAELDRIRLGLEQRDAARRSGAGFRLVHWLGITPAARRLRIRLVTGSLLAGGFGSAIIVYLTAGPEARNPLGYEPEDTKSYLRAMEVYGGKANLLASEFRQWFEGLWHGRTLAYTLACLTVLLAGAFWIAATHLATDADPAPCDRAGGGTPPAGSR